MVYVKVFSEQNTSSNASRNTPKYPEVYSFRNLSDVQDAVHCPSRSLKPLSFLNVILTVRNKLIVTLLDFLNLLLYLYCVFNLSLLQYFYFEYVIPVIYLFRFLLELVYPSVGVHNMRRRGI